MNGKLDPIFFSHLVDPRGFFQRYYANDLKIPGELIQYPDHLSAWHTGIAREEGIKIEDGLPRSARIGLREFTENVLSALLVESTGAGKKAKGEEASKVPPHLSLYPMIL
jgi:hypothetical protein